jgi:hypothetical protein
VYDTTTETSSLSTGDAALDAALDRLDELDESDLERHVEIYDDLPGALGAVLDGTSSGAAAQP